MMRIAKVAGCAAMTIFAAASDARAQQWSTYYGAPAPYAAGSYSGSLSGTTAYTLDRYQGAVGSGYADLTHGPSLGLSSYDMGPYRSWYGPIAPELMRGTRGAACGPRRQSTFYRPAPVGAPCDCAPGYRVDPFAVGH